MKMINTCKICGASFEAKQKNHNICSSECRKINLENLRWRWINDPVAAEKRKQREKHRRRKGKPVYCRICGKPTESYISATGRHAHKHYHDECIINKGIEAILNGEKFTKGTSAILDMVQNHGYSKADSLEIMAERGVKYEKQKPFAVWRG